MPMIDQTDLLRKSYFLASQHVTFRRVARRARQIGEDWLQARGRASKALGQGDATHASAYRSDVANAARGTDLAGSWVSRHGSANVGTDLRPPPPRFYARRRRGNYNETTCEHTGTIG